MVVARERQIERRKRRVIHFQRALTMKEEEQSYIFAKEEQSTGIRRYMFRMSNDYTVCKPEKKKKNYGWG